MRIEARYRRDDASADIILRWVAFSCAVILLLAMLMPNWLARTSWSSGTRDRSSVVIDSPAGYVGLLSLCGLVACIALVLGLGRRRRAIAALLAAAATFICGVGVTATYTLALSRGEALVDGSGAMGPRWTVHWPPLLPVFIIAATTGALSALLLAIRQQHQLADTARSPEIPSEP